MVDWGVGEYAALAAAAASTASTVATVTAKAPESPAAPAPAKDTTEAAAYAQAQALRKRQGAASTVMTSPLGVTSQGNTMHTTLGN